MAHTKSLCACEWKSSNFHKQADIYPNIEYAFRICEVRIHTYYVLWQVHTTYYIGSDQFTLEGKNLGTFLYYDMIDTVGQILIFLPMPNYTFFILFANKKSLKPLCKKSRRHKSTIISLKFIKLRSAFVTERFFSLVEN